MAADGSIIIDTELDNSGFEAGSKKLERAAVGVRNKLESIGTSAQKALSGVLPTLVKGLEQISHGQQSLTAAGAREAAAAQAQIARAADGSSDFAKEMRTLERSTTSLSNRIDKIGESVNNGFSTNQQFSRFQAQVDTTREKIAQLSQQLAEMGSQSVQTSDFSQLSSAQQKAEQALLKLYDRREMQEDTGVKERSQAWQRLSIQIQNAEAQVARYEAAIATMKNTGTAFVQGNATAEYQQIAATLGEMSARLTEYEQLAGGFNTISEPARTSQAALVAVDRELQQKPQDASRASSALSHFGNVMRNITETAANLTRNIARIGFRSISGGIGNATKSLRSFGSQSLRADNLVKRLVGSLTSLKRMLISRVKRMFISSIVNGVQDGIKALAQFDSRFNTAMSNIKNAAKGLSANLSVSLGGLIQSIEPIITRIINTISRAISYINALFAMLGGKSTVPIAKKQMDSYAGAASSAGGAMKELNRQVYGFDELNKRSKNSDSGGGGGTTSTDLFEEVPIDSMLPNSIKDLFERIKEAYTANNWIEIGRVLADGLNAGMAAVDDWITGTLQPKSAIWAERIGQIINGIVSGTDFILMGETLADGLNTVIQAVATFIETIDWRTLGAQLATGVYSLVSNLDFTQFLEGVNAMGNGFFNFISGAIQSINWQSLGSQVYGGIKNVLTTLDYAGIWSAAAEAFGSTVGALTGTVWGFIRSAWSDLAKWWKDVAYEDGQFTMEGLLNGIWDGIKNIGSWVVEHIFNPFIEGFENAFGIHSPSTVMQELGVNIVEGLLNGIREAWSKITSFFSNVLNGLKTQLQSAWSSIKTGASTAWSGIKTTMTTLFDSAKTGVVSVASNLRSSLSGAWNTMKSNATQTWSNIKSSLSSTISSLRSDTESKVNAIKTTTQNAWNSIKTATSSAWSSIQSSVMSRWNSLKSSMQNTSWYSVGSNICSGIASGINAGWSWLSNTVSNLARNLLDTAERRLGINSPSRVFRDEVGRNISLGIAEGVTDTEANVIKAVSNTAQSAVKGFEVSEISFGLSDGVSGLDLVADRLSDIVASFRSITSMLSSMGGISVPQIAAGTVVPLRTKMYTPESYSGNSGFSDFSSDFEEFMTYNADLLKEILEVLKKLHLTIDVDTLSKYVFAAQRKAERSYGL